MDYLPRAMEVPETVAGALVVVVMVAVAGIVAAFRRACRSRKRTADKFAGDRQVARRTHEREA